MKEGKHIPNVDFMVRIKDETLSANDPYKWVPINSYSIFKDKRNLLFSVPGAFTPVCSERQVPDYVRHQHEFKRFGLEEIYCITVNDYFVVNQWANHFRGSEIKFIPDGNGVFTNMMDMLVDKSNVGYGYRSWRYAAIIDNLKIEKLFVEPGKTHNSEVDPYSVTRPDNIVRYLQTKNNK